MPTYAYRCNSCAYEFEEVQKFADKPLITCPSCKKRKLVRLIGGAGLVFKGSGFYQTDYKNQTSGYAESKASAKKDAKSEEKVDTKSDEKSEMKNEEKGELKSKEQGETKPTQKAPAKKKDGGSKK